MAYSCYTYIEVYLGAHSHIVLALGNSPIVWVLRETLPVIFAEGKQIQSDILPVIQCSGLEMTRLFPSCIHNAAPPVIMWPAS